MKYIHDVFSLWSLQGAPSRDIGPPPAYLGKLLTSIASSLTFPKLYLATLKLFYSSSLKIRLGLSSILIYHADVYSS